MKIISYIITAALLLTVAAPAQTIADSSLTYRLSVIYNSNLSTQQEYMHNILFVAAGSAPVQSPVDTTTSSSSVNSVDPGAAFPYSIDTTGYANTTADGRLQLDHYYSIALGFISTDSATITITGKFTTTPNGNYYAWLERISTGEVFHFLDDTVTINIPAVPFYMNLDAAADFRLHIGPAVTKTVTNETCYGDGLGAIRVQNPASNWQLEIFRNSSLLINTAVSSNDTSITALAQGNYTIVTRMDNITIDSGAVTVGGPAQVVPAFTAGNSSPFVDSLDNFSNSSTDATTFTWDFGDSFTSNSVNAAHAYSSPGQYIVTLTATNDAGCSASVTDTLHVTLAPVMLVPGDRFDNHNNTDYQTYARTGEQKNFTAIPGEQKITVTFTDAAANAQVDVLDMNGQLVASTTVNSTSVDMPVNQTGIYIVRVLNNNRFSTSRVLVNR